jgi:hypothetical protein
MRQFKAISLVALLVLPGMICFCFLQWQKAHVRHDVKERLISGIDRDSLTKLTFSVHESQSLLEWEHEREFNYAEVMYDIVETFQNGDSITYYCWKDDDETHLNDLLSSLTTSSLDQDPKNKSQRSVATNILKVHYLAPDRPITQPLSPALDAPVQKVTRLNTRFVMPPPTPPPVHS